MGPGVVAVVTGPVEQQRADPVEVHPHGVGVAGMAAGAALAAGPQPVPDAGGYRLGQDREPSAGDVAGQDDGQGTSGLGDDPGVPAAGPGKFSCDAAGLGQGLAGDVGGDPAGFAGVQGLAGNRQLELCPGGRGRRPGTAGCPGCGPVWPSRLIPANDSCWPVPGTKSAGVIRRRGEAAMPACSQHSRQCPFLIARIRRQLAHSPGWQRRVKSQQARQYERGP